MSKLRFLAIIFAIAALKAAGVAPADISLNGTWKFSIIPADTLSGYAVEYTDRHGTRRRLPMPVMRPGEEVQLTLPDINTEYRFDVVRRNGSVVAQY